MVTHIGTTRIQPGLLLQTLAIVAGCELAIMFLLPVILPGATAWVAGGMDTLLLTVTAGPLLWWRFSRRLAEAKAAPTSGETASSLRRVRVVSIAGLTCVAVLAAGGAVALELSAKTGWAKAELVDKICRQRMCGQGLTVAAAMRTLDPSPTQQRAFAAALERYEARAGVLRDRLGSSEAKFSCDPEIAPRWNEALAAIQRVLAAGRTIAEAFDQGRTDRAALDELLAAHSAAVEKLDALNKIIVANDPSGAAAMKLLGRGLGLLLMSALVLVWLLAMGPAVQRAAQTERELAERERRFRTMVEAVQVIVWEYDCAGQAFTYVSPQAERMGYPLEQWLQPGFWEAHVHPQDRAKVVALCKELTLAGQDHRLQYRMFTADGGEMWIDDFVSVDASEAGMPKRRGVLVDITERMEAQQALANARDHAEAVNADLVGLNESHAALFACRTTADVAQVLTDTLVRNFDAYFARVWLRRPADICSECTLAPHCPAKQECLHLMASSGFYTHIDGPHRRVPLGAFKIGLIAQGAGKTISHDVVNDERVHDRQWAAEHGLRSFVGLPLLRDGRVIGVMAMFSRNDLPEHFLETIEILATVGAAAIANVELIDSHRVATQAAETAACQDKLTGLPNRALLHDRLRHAIERARRLPEYQFAVIFLDLDRFKIINDSLGHEFGDRFLQAIAARLRENLRAGDSISRDAEGASVARLGGDEFIVFLDGIKRPEDAATVADRLLKGLEAPYQLGGHELRSTASMGIVCSNSEYRKADEILRDADTAMYEAKARGKACFVMFDASMQEVVQNRLQIENDLRAAVGSDQFLLVYQPIVSLEDGELRGVEALIRWNHPTRGLVMPGEFILIAEETRLILPLSNWIVEQACTQFMKWRRQAPDRAPAYVSVNLSRIHLAEQDLVEQIIRTVQRAGMEPGQLQLEMTESGIMQDRKAAKKTLRALKAAGIRLAMDDFGTGHSSLSCLHEFPFDVLKIDRSFIARLKRGRKFRALTRSIITFAECLGMVCVSEGVENREQFAVLQSMGCTCAQGYYFGKPMSADALLDGRWMDGYRSNASPACR